MKKILIIGVSTTSGKVLLTNLKSSKKNLDITCFVRNSEKLSSFSKLNIIKWDLASQSSLSTVMKDKDMVITFLNGENLVTLAENVIKSMKENIFHEIEVV